MKFSLNLTPWCMICFFIFLVLKLTHYIDWSWWCVTAPIWIPLGLIVFFLILIIVGGAVIAQ